PTWWSSASTRAARCSPATSWWTWPATATAGGSGWTPGARRAAGARRCAAGSSRGSPRSSARPSRRWWRRSPGSGSPPSWRWRWPASPRSWPPAWRRTDPAAPRRTPAPALPAAEARWRGAGGERERPGGAPPAVRSGLRAAGVGVRPGAGQLAAVDDEVLLPDRRAVQPRLQDLPGAGGVAGLGGQRGTGHVRGHPVVRHGPPRVVRRGGLGVPDVAGVPGQPAALQRAHDRVAVGDPRPGRVDQVGAALHGAEQLVAEQALGLGVQRGVDGHHVADRGHVLG